jgi:hypothetical protein
MRRIRRYDFVVAGLAELSATRVLKATRTITQSNRSRKFKFGPQMCRLCLAPLFVIAGFLPLAALDEIEEFRTVLQRIIRASRENFRPVEGARIDLYPGRRSYFQARVDLPGTTECRIDETPVLAYSCKWKPEPKAITPGALCKRLTDQVEAALGSEWQRQESRQRNSVTSFKNTGRYRQTQIAVEPTNERPPACLISISVKPGN